LHSVYTKGNTVNYNSQQYAVKAMHIKRLIVAQTGTYNQQYRRPYTSSLDGTSRTQMLDAIEQSKTITPATVAGVSNQFIKPAATPECMIDIANGWATQRLRFMMEIQSQDMMGNITSEYVVGYTDHPGLSLGGHLDPSMVFTINAINTTRTKTQTSHSLGAQTYQNFIDASSILVNDHYNGAIAPQQLFGLRPEDVYSQLDNQTLAEGLGEDSMLVAARSLITTRAIKSRRSNAIAPVYVAKVLDSYLQTTRADMTSGDSELYEQARCSVRSQSANEDPFMAFLRTKSNTETNYQFTYGDLMMLDPNVVSPSVTIPVPVKPIWQSGLHQAGQTAHWGGTDYTTLFATTLSQSLPGYMLSFGLNKLHLFATNLDSTGAISIQPSHWKSFSENVDMTNALTSLCYRLEVELLRDMCHSGEVLFNLEIKCDLLGDTFTRISLNGEPPVEFMTPSFCDSLLAPMVTSNNLLLDGITSDFGCLMREIADGHVTGATVTSNQLGIL
jgi:hypothetical protein